MLTITPQTNRALLTFENSNHNNRSKKNNSFKKNIDFVSQQTNDLSFHKKNTVPCLFNKKDNDINNSKTTLLKKTINIILGVGFLSGANYFLNKINKVECVGINSFTKMQNNYNLANLFSPLTDESKTFIHSEAINLNTNSYNHKLTKRDNNHPYKYYYTKHQEEKCKTQELQNKCQRTHVKARKKGNVFTCLILNVGKTNCFCPPPYNKNVTIVEPAIKNRTTKKTKNNIKNEHINIIGNKSKKSSFIPNTSRIKPEGEEGKIDDITIKRLYDYSCIEESQKTNFSSALKIIGETLANPVEKMSQQVNIYHNYEILHFGCPSVQDQERISNITKAIDSVMNNVIQLLPGSKSIMILQNIIAPLLIAESEEIDGEEINIDLINQAHQNLMFVFQDTVRSQSIDSYINTNNPALALKNDETEHDKCIVTYKDKAFSILLDENLYELHHHQEGTPFILENGHHSLVSYNKSLKNG